MIRSLVQNPNRMLAMALVAGTAAAGCGGSSDESLPPDQTPEPAISCQLKDMDCTAEVLDYPPLSTYDVERQQKVATGSHVITGLYLNAHLHERYARTVKPLAQFILGMSERHETFSVQDHTGATIRYTPQENSLDKHRIIFGPADLPLTPGAPAGSESLAVTITPVHTSQIQDETISIVGEEPLSGKSEYPGGKPYYDTIRTLGTEACHALLAIEPDVEPSASDYYDKRTLGQELYCNSLSFALGAALNGISFERYDQAAPTGTMAIGNYRYPLLPVSKETYQDFEELEPSVSPHRIG